MFKPSVDIYLIYHSLWNIDYDIDAGRREFFKLAYGAAADDMLAFYNRVERNSDAVMKTMMIPMIITIRESTGIGLEIFPISFFSSLYRHLVAPYCPLNRFIIRYLL